jgi:signal transduction histidine kinase
MHPDGLGFDLYVAKLIVTRLGGDIQFDSKIGEGTVFTISLPLHPVKT